MTSLLCPLTSRLQNYDATCRLAQEIAENIHERSRQQRTGGNPAKVTCVTFTGKVAFLYIPPQMVTFLLVVSDQHDVTGVAAEAQTEYLAAEGRPVTSVIDPPHVSFPLRGHSLLSQ